MTASRLLIILASTRQGRVGPGIADWVDEQALAHGAFVPDVADLAAIGLPFLDEPEHPNTGRYAHQHTRDWSARVAAADAFVFVMPEYNHGFSAPLKNALDFLHVEWHHKPVGFVSYGGLSGGLRAVNMIKPVVSALRMTPAFCGVFIPHVEQHLHEDGRFRPTSTHRSASTAMLDELARLEPASRSLRAQVGVT